MNKTALVVAAHTDDEALGCSGTILRHVAEGDTVYALFLADGVTSRQTSDSQDLETRNSAAEKARTALGIQKNFYLGLPDNRLDTVPLLDIIYELEKVIEQVQPQVVYTHHLGDLNIDHQITHQAVMTACRPQPNSHIHEIYTFEVMSSTEWATPATNPFLPNYYVDITDYLEAKLNALSCYKNEMRSAPHSRTIEHIAALAKHRGYSVGVNAAEAFMAVRVVR
ncbi:MAG: PIG-L family deacetylase [Flavobacteriales bacterium]|nr:PIG-L family deacetylase [Flavobacteriales bacterium]